ncbi:hypothetical protein RND71_039874 [Anisodus tanguticus]|uniref:Uncharacterized protein n=1 Tax=Anisodus tanguticus TaxID=243964 RepID=A0AAE1QY72_9SOLA|nr:hypothetical protein RND71_039874 [Anisodus tanguticus]
MRFCPKGIPRHAKSDTADEVTTSQVTFQQTSEETPTPSSSSKTESDSDIEVNAFLEKFYSKAKYDKWDWYKNRIIRSEKVLDIASCSEYGLVEFLNDRKLLKSVTEKDSLMK